MAFVANRGGVVALLCWVSTLRLYAAFLARPRPALYLGTLVLTLAGLLSKATTVVLPLVLFLFHMHRAPAERARRIALLLAPHFLLAAGLAFVHVEVARDVGVIAAEDPIGLLQHIPGAWFTIEFYVWKFLWPTGLTSDYEGPALLTSWLPLAISPALRASWLPLALLAPFLLGGFTWVVWCGQPRRTLPWFLAWSYLAALIPVMNLLPTSPPVADRYAQLPLLALSPLLVGLPLAHLPVQGGRALALILVTLLGGMSVHQLSAWHDDEALQRHAAAHNPESSKVLHNLSMVLWERGRREEALSVARKLRDRHPQSFEYDYLRGLAAIDERRFAAAVTSLEAATRKSGAEFSAWAALGGAYEASGRIDEAREAYAQALERLRAQPIYEPHGDEVERRLRRLEGSAGARTSGTH